MGQRREILERLAALERRGGRRDDHDCGDHHHGGHHHHHGHHEHERENDFDEKRVIDTIVRLVTEQVGKLLDKQQSGERDRNERNDGYDEKRIVDLIVACVSEHVQEIVATELDRRLGPPDAKGEERPAKPGRSRGGSSESEPA